MHGWSVKHPAVVQCESRVMPGARDSVAQELAFRKRPAEVRARLGQGENPGSATDQKDRNTVVLGALRLSFGQFGFGQHGYKVGRKSLAGGLIGAHSVLINHFPAQTRGSRHYSISERTQYPVSYTHLRAHETGRNLVCRLL